jgi:hypothetical protein
MFDVGAYQNLTTHLFPRSTVADARWIVSSLSDGVFIVSFMEFRIALGVSILFGYGQSISHQTELVKIASRDVNMSHTDNISFQLSEMWIWFRAAGQNTVAEQQHTADSIQLISAVKPTVNGISLRIEHTRYGKIEREYIL